jgi:carbamoyl-phosphate synthase small subunit
MSRTRPRALLVLADGTTFEGWAFGAQGEAAGEVVFNTAMSGYQEILTDPSYRGQIVVMTYPHIGNYGVNEDDVESASPQAAGFVVRRYHETPSSWRARRTLSEYLEGHGIVGIEGIDTRALTRHLRSAGVMEGVISTRDLAAPSLLRKARETPSMLGRDLVREVTCAEPYHWEGGGTSPRWGGPTPRSADLRVVAYDFGIKWNLLRRLVDAGCDVTVVPASTSAEAALALDPDGIFLSNGPGDPAALGEIVREVGALLGKRPVFGVCLGHQLMALALGGRTYKLKFGHRGANQPVMELQSGKVAVTSHNHGFAVDADSLRGAARVTHLNLNDRTVEGLCHDEMDCFSVQYHPEAAPGPHDAADLFDRFAERMRRYRDGRI